MYNFPHRVFDCEAAAPGAGFFSLSLSLYRAQPAASAQPLLSTLSGPVPILSSWNRNKDGCPSLPHRLHPSSSQIPSRSLRSPPPGGLARPRNPRKESSAKIWFFLGRFLGVFFSCRWNIQVGFLQAPDVIRLTHSDSRDLAEHDNGCASCLGAPEIIVCLVQNHGAVLCQQQIRIMTIIAVTCCYFLTAVLWRCCFSALQAGCQRSYKPFKIRR